MSDSNTLEVKLLSFNGSQAELSSPIGTGLVMPVLSPDGRSVAYFRVLPSFGLYVADADGKNERRLASAGQLHYQNPPVWSARGEKIAIESARSNAEGAPSDILVVNTDGSGVVNVTRGAVSGHGPVWAPDGSRLVFGGFESDNRTSNIYTANADGSGLQRLTSNAPGQGAWSAAWSPDGSLIAYVTNRDGNGEVYVMRPDGSNQTNLTRSPSGEFMGPIGNPPMAFSPDGRKVAFLSDRFGNIELFSVNVDGSGLQRLTSDPGDEFSPRWTADGSCLTFYSSRPSPAGGINIYVVRADGSGFAQLTVVR